MNKIKLELENNLSEIKSALTIASSSLEGVVASDVLCLARAYNETVKTLIEVNKQNNSNSNTKELTVQNQDGDKVLSISFNDILNKNEKLELETPTIEVESVN